MPGGAALPGADALDEGPPENIILAVTSAVPQHRVLAGVIRRARRARRSDAGDARLISRTSHSDEISFLDGVLLSVLSSLQRSCFGPAVQDMGLLPALCGPSSQALCDPTKIPGPQRI